MGKQGDARPRDGGGASLRLPRHENTFVASTALVSVQSPLRLDAYSEPEPDLTLLRSRADDYRASHPSAAEVFFLVEVSHSSLTYDRGAKLALYANNATSSNQKLIEARRLLCRS